MKRRNIIAWITQEGALVLRKKEERTSKGKKSHKGWSKEQKKWLLLDKNRFTLRQTESVLLSPLSCVCHHHFFIRMKLKEDVPPLFLHVFRSVVWVYSFITFIPWYFLSGAEANQTRAKRIKARAVSSAISAFSVDALHVYLIKLVCFHMSCSSFDPAIGSDQNNWSEMFLNFLGSKQNLVRYDFNEKVIQPCMDLQYAVYFRLRVTFFVDASKLSYSIFLTYK